MPAIRANPRSITTAVLVAALRDGACRRVRLQCFEHCCGVEPGYSPRRPRPPARARPSSASEALAAYRAMWAEVVAANTTSNYQAPDLGDHLGGQALTTLTANMAAEKAQGVIVLGQPILHPIVVSASATSVNIQDCVDEAGWLQHFAASPQKLVDDVPGGDRSTTATVSDENGIWKVIEMDSGSDGSCHATP